MTPGLYIYYLILNANFVYLKGLFLVIKTTRNFINSKQPYRPKFQILSHKKEPTAGFCFGACKEELHRKRRIENKVALPATTISPL